MDIQIKIYISDDGQIHLVLGVQAHGETHFRGFNAFAAFVEECYKWIESCKRFAMIEPPIPEAFLSAFNDDSDM